MTYWFPSREWLTAYRDGLNDNETYREASEGWGDGFDGDFVFVVADLPVEETTIGDLPDELSNGFRGNLEDLSDERIEELISDAPPALEERLSTREGSPHDRFISALLETSIEDAPDVTWPNLLEDVHDDLENLLDQFERYVHADTVYAYLDLYGGECREIEVLEDPAAHDAGFVLTGPYEKWVDLIDGADVLEVIFSRGMDIDGAVTTIMGYGDAAQEMGDTASHIETDVLF